MNSIRILSFQVFHWKSLCTKTCYSESFKPTHINQNCTDVGPTSWAEKAESHDYENSVILLS